MDSKQKDLQNLAEKDSQKPNSVAESKKPENTEHACEAEFTSAQTIQSKGIDSHQPNSVAESTESKNSKNIEYVRERSEAEAKCDSLARADTINGIASHQPKFQKVIDGAYDLSLGISIIVAIALGFALGFGLKKLFSYEWLLWLGIFWGICAAILNIYKAYKRQKKALDELAKNPRYNSQAFLAKQKQWDKEDDED